MFIHYYNYIFIPHCHCSLFTKFLKQIGYCFEYEYRIRIWQKLQKKNTLIYLKNILILYIYTLVLYTFNTKNILTKII